MVSISILMFDKEQANLVGKYFNMSRPQEPHRPFFHFGNPLPKGSQLSPSLLSLLNAFEVNLSKRLQKLVPKDKDDILSFDGVTEIHRDINNLIADLEIPLIDWDDKWLDVYLDISVKLLDISLAFTSEITRLNQSHLLLQFVLHKLESNSPERFMQACSSLDSWRQHIGTKNPRLETCHPILHNLVESLNLPKVKNSAKGKVLVRAMYGAKVAIVYICSVFTAALSGSAPNLLDLSVLSTLPWASVFFDVQTTVNSEVRKMFSCGKFTGLRELDAVDACVKTLYPLLQDGFGSNEVLDLRRTAEELSQGLDNLSKAVDGYFKIGSTGGYALLCNLRTSVGVPNSMLGRKVEEQALR
ncbi:hypothetical protein CXB51_019845 [Gossypium anomalum]|uniref:Uncharacterized protein n=1 Tax=Gossypium anomalum TaxID=47600 RepID=A0A8J6D032_9ROSI|nr:hypothetical protein CXB51_019845 [Gossypium anomalum]